MASRSNSSGSFIRESFKYQNLDNSLNLEKPKATWNIPREAQLPRPVSQILKARRESLIRNDAKNAGFLFMNPIELKLNDPKFCR